jgi:hypothetical protein
MSRKKETDIKGFEDLFSQKELEKMSSTNQKNTTNESSTGLELLWFLENEEIRIEKLNNLFTDAVHNLDAYPISQKLTEKQKKVNIEIRKEIINKMNHPKSDFITNLTDILKIHFS